MRRGASAAAVQPLGKDDNPRASAAAPDLRSMSRRFMVSPWKLGPPGGQTGRSGRQCKAAPGRRQGDGARPAAGRKPSCPGGTRPLSSRALVPSLGQRGQSAMAPVSLFLRPPRAVLATFLLLLPLAGCSDYLLRRVECVGSFTDGLVRREDELSPTTTQLLK